MQVQVVLPQEVMAAAQAAATAFHSQSKQFSVRYMAAADTNLAQQAEEFANSIAAGRADTGVGGVPIDPRSDAQQASAATGTGVLDGAVVTDMLDNARVAARKEAAHDQPKLGSGLLQASSALGSLGGAAPGGPDDSGKVQPGLKQDNLVIEERPNQNSRTDDSITREQQNLLASDVDTEDSKRASEHHHAEL